MCVSGRTRLDEGGEVNLPERESSFLINVVKDNMSTTCASPSSTSLSGDLFFSHNHLSTIASPTCMLRVKQPVTLAILSLKATRMIAYVPCA